MQTPCSRCAPVLTHDLQRQIALLPRKATDVGVDPLTVALHDALCRRTQHEPAAFVNGGCHLLSHHKACFSVRPRAADSELHCPKPNYLLGLYGEHRQVGP
jgi:hypothetical protein